MLKTSPFSRHLKTALLATALTAGVCSPALADKTKIKMLFWTFQPEAVQAFVNEFMQRNPDIEVQIEGVSSAEYNAKAALMFRSKTPFDVAYIRDTALPEWVSNGWVAPIDDCAGVAEAKKNMLPLALQGQTYQDHLYGLTYYTGIFPLIVNKSMLAKAGIDTLPTTFDGWFAAAKAVKDKGIVEYPMVFPIRSYGWGATYIWGAMAKAMGGKAFDNDFNPTPEGLAALTWWRKAFEAGLVNPASIEWGPADAANVFVEGQAAIQWSMLLYAGNAFANSEKSKVRGQVVLAKPPQTGQLVGQAAMYGINAQSKNKEAACKLVTFLGTKDQSGQYATPKAWVKAATLTWGERGIEKDPDVRAAITGWGGDPDQIAQFLEDATHLKDVLPYDRLWYTEWEDYSNKQLQEILIGRASVADGLKRMSDRARALDRRYKK
ncbi:sugar ABC transporter substrate-binding protein [Bosea sp. (in: a-proteobacteria)]|uniref:ABC transporter substrate-binding protein n=1 Tax=Bosea sp. (in: a-proteobacteria) TaxID=1871050 RepID=UPI002633F105|nr:sugar ABC transporter substrate-binding protein [Bosea sp. (in: a-proteobacteria)]MCO5089550.1 sugar ABC transporter substrate-binding protein [Bosea sp. (in: a-proteobacteria)]